MRKTRNTLLIALVFFGVSLAAVASAQTDIRSKLGYAPADPAPALQPAADPNAGEPDVGQGGPARVSMKVYDRSTTRVRTTPTAQAVRSPFATQIWWAWSMWMARYLNQTP